MVSPKVLNDINDMINDIINPCEHFTFLKGQDPGSIVISLCGLFLSWWLIMSNRSSCPESGEFTYSITRYHCRQKLTMNMLRAPAQTNGRHHPATAYPRVLPASLPRVSEPERNHGESLVLPGLEVLPAPELLFNFDLGKNKR